MTLDPRGCEFAVVNSGDSKGPRWVSSLADTDSNAILNIEDVKIKNYTIPLVLDGRYFVVELTNGCETWIVFRLGVKTIVIDFIRSTPRPQQFGEANSSDDGALVYLDDELGVILYRIEPKGEDPNFLFLTNEASLSMASLTAA